MEKRPPKIAIVTAFLGNGGNSGALRFTAEAMYQIEQFGIDVYSFCDKDKSLIEPFLQPSFNRSDIAPDSFFNWLQMKWYKLRYKQPIYPSKIDDYTRLLAKVPKILFYKLVPQKYDYYVWLDSKFEIQEHWVDYLLWLIDRHEGYDIITSKHSERGTIREEVRYMLFNRKRVEWSLPQKYDMAKIARQYSDYKKMKGFKDDKLFELTMIIYSKSIFQKKEFCEEWYAHNSYYSIQDQLSFPILVNKYKLKVYPVVCRVFDMPFTWHEYAKG